MYKTTVKCPCCEREFTGEGSNKQEADEIANEALQDHLDTEEC